MFVNNNYQEYEYTFLGFNEFLHELRDDRLSDIPDEHWIALNNYCRLV